MSSGVDIYKYESNFTSYVTMGKVYNLSESQSPHL
jgi:hypothetical protein